MKLAIVDDNEIEQEIILNTLNAYHKESGISLEIQSFSDGDSFLNAYKSGNYDLIFMDIFLNAYKSGNYDLIFMDIFLKNLNGIDIVRKIRQSDLKVLIVFLTMSSDHIFEAAPLHFFDYILKPFEYKQIFHVLNDARQILPQSKNQLSFEYRNINVHFPLSKIQYIYSNNHDVIIHTTIGSQLFRLPFYSITQNLDDPRFLQCNRGILLNMDYIKAMEADYFEMTDSKCFPIKTKGRKQIREQYIQYHFLKLEEE